MLWRVTVCVGVETVRVCDSVEALSGPTRTIHCPDASGRAVSVLSSSLTVTVSPGAAWPQIGITRSRCKMPSSEKSESSKVAL